MPKPLKFHQLLNQPTRNARHGKYRRPDTTSHRNPADRAGDGAGGAFTHGPGIALWSISWSGDGTNQNPGEGAGLSSAQLAAAQQFLFGSLFEFATPLPSVVTTGELIGYRGWWLINGYLYSIAHERRWEPGAVMEGDVDNWVRDTIEGGVYSHKDAEISSKHGVGFGRMLDRMSATSLMWMLGLSRHHEFIRDADAFVAGTVKLWGQVVEHEHGYRAQFARIASLDAVHAPSYCDDDAQDWLEELRRRYQV